MLFFDHKTVKESLENLQAYKNEVECCFARISDSIDIIEKTLPKDRRDVHDLVSKKEEMTLLLLSLQRLIDTLEYVQCLYSETREKLIKECEEMFICPDVSKKMKKISLESYHKEMKGICFEKRYENE